jgi:hypothetical protein
VRAIHWALIVAAAGCGTRTKYVQTNTPPATLRARMPHEVEILDKAPTRPFLQIGLFEAGQATAYNKTDAIVQKLRREAGKIGCEALLIETTSENGAVGLKSFKAACLVYTAQPAAAAPRPVASATAAKPKACTPNDTRVCYGPGACQGGQYCLPDGSGYSACDCGSKGDAGVPPPTQK